MKAQELEDLEDLEDLPQEENRLNIKDPKEVTFIDYGNQSTVAFKDIRPLDPKFRSLPGQAQDARLR